MEFRILSTDKKSHARAGLIKTSHGSISTPIFMPVGTAGTVKAVHHQDLDQLIGAQIILGNTYHLYLRPGIRLLEEAGGLHGFMSWDKPILTDSGGYQVYSLSHRRKLTREGVAFQSHIDGSRHFFTPEKVMEIQRYIGADIMMAFDECTPFPCEFAYAKESMHLTHHWLDRCINKLDSSLPLYGHEQVLFPIVQGSIYKDLRIESAHYVAEQNMPGNAIGGLSVGEPEEMMYEMTEVVCNILPPEKPRYLMGVGTPANILECISRGVDMFDCVMPTRNGRNGMLFTSEGIINIRNQKWKNDISPIDPNGSVYVDTHYSRAYLRHLFTCNEMLGPMIATMHNLAFYIDLVKKAREHILIKDFAEWKTDTLKRISKRL